MNKKLLMISILVTCLYGCKRQNPGNVPIDSELKRLFSYKAGTYWIYYDSISNQTDSFVVVSNNLSSIAGNDQNRDLETDYISVYNGSHLLDSLSGSWQLSGSSINFFYTSSPDVIGYSPFLTIPYPNYNYLYKTGSDEYELIDTFPNYTVSNQNFEHIIEISRTSYFNYSDTFFIDSIAGIIKMNLHHLESSIAPKTFDCKWEIRRFKIIH